MKYILLLVVLSSSCTQKNQKPADCARFKTGTFVIDDEEQPFRITRTSNAQEEKDLTTGFSYKYYVHWKDDCSYELSFWETNDPKFEDDKKKLTITLVKTAGDTYFYESTLEGGYSQRSGKVRKVK